MDTVPILRNIDLLEGNQQLRAAAVPGKSLVNRGAERSQKMANLRLKSERAPQGSC